MRKQIMNTFTVKEGLFEKEQLETADIVFTTNALGISPIKKIQEREYEESHPLYYEILRKLSL